MNENLTDLYDLMFTHVIDPTDFRPKTGLIRYAGEAKKLEKQE